MNIFASEKFYHKSREINWDSPQFILINSELTNVSSIFWVTDLAQSLPDCDTDIKVANPYSIIVSFIGDDEVNCYKSLVNCPFIFAVLIWTNEFSFHKFPPSADLFLFHDFVVFVEFDGPIGD